MSDFESMREKHRKDSMLTLSFFVLFVLMFFFHEHYVTAFSRLIADPGQLWEVLAKSWPVLLFTLVTPFVSYFFGILTIARRDLYYDIDNRFVGRRKAVDEMICKRMINFNIDLESEDVSGLERLKSQLNAKCGNLMSLFYAYVEKDDVVNPQLKKHAFTYWGDYFSSLMFVFWGLLAIACTGLIIFWDNSFSYLRLGIWVVMLATIGMNLYAVYRGKAAKMQFEIPKTQVSEMHRNAATCLLDDLRKEDFFVR